MMDRQFFIDYSRCIGCQSCVQACAECDTHRGTSMIHLETIERMDSVQTAPQVCMHCEDPVAPCAQVCPALAILITPEGVVQQADPSRCIACRNCVYACPFGVPKFDVEARLMKKCNLCYDRTVQGLQTWCAQACPTDAMWYGTFEEFEHERRGHPVRDTTFGTQSVRTRVYHVLPEETPKLDVLALLREIDVGAREPRKEAWVL